MRDPSIRDSRRLELRLALRPPRVPMKLAAEPTAPPTAPPTPAMNVAGLNLLLRRPSSATLAMPPSAGSWTRSEGRCFDMEAPSSGGAGAIAEGARASQDCAALPKTTYGSLSTYEHRVRPGGYEIIVDSPFSTACDRIQGILLRVKCTPLFVERQRGFIARLSRVPALYRLESTLANRATGAPP